MADQPSLSPDAILIAEFNYITQAAAQANEDRARVTSFYLVTFGSFIAGLVTAQFNIAPELVQMVIVGFATLFTGLALMGLLTIFQLARLRMAWIDSMSALNKIKEYYTNNLASFNLKHAFAWNNEKLPPRFKYNSVGLMLVLQVAVLGGIAFGTAGYLLLTAANVQGIGWPIVATILFTGFQVWLYWRLLK